MRRLVKSRRRKNFAGGDRTKAAEAYQQALVREPDNQQALWGAALLAVRSKDLPMARSHLQALTTLKPDFMYGDASLLYGQVLFDLEDFNAAKAHLLEQVQLWTQPEAYLMLAKIQQKQGDSQAAREALETMIIKIKSSTPFQYRKNQKCVRQGERMLKAAVR